LEQDKIIGNHFSNYFKTREFTINGESSLVLNALDTMGKDTSFHADIIPLQKNNRVYENLIICQDRTYLKHLDKSLEYASGFDSLTGLPNRSPLLKQMDESIVKNEKDKKHFAICYIDIENFTQINDEYGYHAGDMLLKHTAQILSDFVRKEDMVSRIGGDEFVILIDKLQTKESVDKTLDRIIKLPAKNKLHYSEEDIIEFNFILGLSFYPYDSKNSNELIQIAKKQTKKK
jgi:diguanylate cyclase (GGDEF)-like protein